MCISSLEYFAIYRHEAKSMNTPKHCTSAVVVSGLSNLNDYVYKQTDELMEEKCKEKFGLATEMTSKDFGIWPDRRVSEPASEQQ
jgi:hypothetical protein